MTRDCVVAVLFEAAQDADAWGRHDLGNTLRAMAFDFKKGGEITTAPNRRTPGQPSQFAGNRLRARLDECNYHPKTGSVR
ncbi:hypothetical protein [Aurantiacibacter suaedae]|uniref:hypothetical protein n=1 Tax=Aurantiacibacter suaedae TaxID=2545755 RepID=UPI0010F8C78D|nr:hypothetical protein [Aurantiacibacter suaedae]